MNINAPLSIRRRMGLEIFRRLENERTEEHQLKQLFWECTLRCNLHCRHCGSDCKKIAGHPDMPKEDFLRVLDSVSAQNDPHKIFVIITGGEPLMRKDLEECGRAIYERGFPWGMVTNGLYMTRERLNGLLDAGLHTATVSLDGFATDHNWMRGNPQSFERAVEAIKLMVQVPDFVFDVVTCVNKHSYMRLEELKDFLISLGVKGWRLFTIFPVGRAAKDPELQLSNEEFRGVMEFIRKSRKEGRIHVSYGCEGFLGNYEAEVRDTFFACRAGISVGSVLYTDSGGEFVSQMMRDGWVDTKKLIFNDIDGEANGGTFKSDSVCMKDMESKQIKKGDGNWYLGTYEYNMEIKLSKEDK